MRIAQLQPSDLGAYKALMLHAYTAAADAFTTTAEERAEMPDSWWLKRIADPTGMSLAFGTLEGAELIGTVTIEFAAKPKTRHKAHVIGLFVLESARGKGAGRLLLQTALRAAAERDEVLIATLTVTEGNQAAAPFISHAGLRPSAPSPWRLPCPTATRARCICRCSLRRRVTRRLGRRGSQGR